MRVKSATRLLLLGWIALFTLGCGRVNPDLAVPAPGHDAKSALDYVNKSQMGKMLGTSGARFKPDSGKDLTGGKFEIEDTAGKKYHLTVTPEGSSFKATDPQPAP